MPSSAVSKDPAKGRENIRKLLNQSKPKPSALYPRGHRTGGSGAFESQSVYWLDPALSSGIISGLLN